jgi:hypothetical protein
LHREERSFHIRVEYVVEKLFRNRAQRDESTDAGVGENDVDTPFALTVS